MPPFVAQAFWPLITHSPAASSKRARVRTAETSEPAFGSEAQKAATLTSSGGPEAARDPFADLLAGALAEDRRGGERGAHDRHADAGVAPEELLVDDRHHEPGRVGEELRQPFEAVEADLRGLLDDRPRRLLLLVPLVRGGPHDVRGKAVDPVADVLLVGVQLSEKAGASAVGSSLDGVAVADTVISRVACWRGRRYAVIVPLSAQLAGLPGRLVPRQRDHVLAAGRRAATSATVTFSSTMRRFARSATQTSRSAAAGPAYSTSSGRLAADADERALDGADDVREVDLLGGHARASSRLRGRAGCARHRPSAAA